MSDDWWDYESGPFCCCWCEAGDCYCEDCPFESQSSIDERGAKKKKRYMSDYDHPQKLYDRYRQFCATVKKLSSDK